MGISTNLHRLIDPSWTEPNEPCGALWRSRSQLDQMFDQESYEREPSVGMDQVLTCLDDSPYGCSNTFSQEASSVYSCPDRKLSRVLAPDSVREVDDQDLKDLHYQHSFNARLILQALCRKLRFIREDRRLPLGASTSSATSAEDMAFVTTLNREHCILDQITNCFFEVDRKYTAKFDPGFYVGFWDAWTDIRDIGLARLVEERYLSGIRVIENARLDLYFPQRHKQFSDLDSSIHNSNYNLSRVQSNLSRSISQSSLYTAENESYAQQEDPDQSLMSCRRAPSFESRRLDGQMEQNSRYGNFRGPGNLRLLNNMDKARGQMKYNPKYSSRSKTSDRECSLALTSIPLTEGSPVAPGIRMIGNDTSSDSREDETIASFACQGLEHVLDLLPNECTTHQDQQGSFVTRESSNKLSLLPSHRWTNSKRASTNARDKAVDDTCGKIIETDSCYGPGPALHRPDLGNADELVYEKKLILKAFLQEQFEDDSRSLMDEAHAEMLTDSLQKKPSNDRRTQKPLKLLNDSVFDPAQTNITYQVLADQCRGSGRTADGRKPRLLGEMERHHSKQELNVEHLQARPGNTKKSLRRKKRVIPGLKTNTTRFELD